MKTKTEIIQETAAFYNSGNRAVDSGNMCCYLTSDGRKCAVGRCMANPTLAMIGSAADLKSDNNRLVLKDELLPEYREHSVVFWIELQSFHDPDYHWNKTGLTMAGERYLEYLLDKYKD